MIRMRVVLLAAVVLLVALGATSAYAATPPFEENSECLECHDLTTGSGAISRVDFTVPAVDYDKCNNCHYQNGTSGDHWHQPTACKTCHYSWLPPAAPSYSPQVGTPYGWFDNAGSVMASPQSLHGTHTGGNWVDQWGLDPALGCSRCHAPTGCDGCHESSIAHDDHAGADVAPVPYRNTISFASGVRTSNITCIDSACHALADAATEAFVPDCTACHPTNSDPHGYETTDHVADVGSDADPGATTCDSCHDMDLGPEHEKATSSSAGDSCATCHPTPRDTFGVWNQSCEQGGCHANGSATERHTGADAAHVPAAAGTMCLDCHTGPGLDDVHSTATTTTASGTYENCNVCHNPEVAAYSNDCTECHFTFDNHYDEAKHESTWTLESCDDSGCHSTRDLMGVHAEKNLAFECADCHESTDPAVEDAIATGNTACDACHAGVTEDEGHREAHPAVPPLVDMTGTPYYSYVYGSLGTQPTTDCLGCHASNLIDEHLGVAPGPPRKDRAGDSLDCSTCHDNPDVADAILNSLTNCDACHQVHDQIPIVHESGYLAGDPGMPTDNCGGCHSAQLEVEHAGMSVTPNGRALTGCELCHGYYDSYGPRGVMIQDAIAAKDTRCTACHSDIHPDTTASHTATTTASVEDCGRCHNHVVDGAIYAPTLHVDAAEGECAVCHDNPGRVPDITATTAECVSCHAIEGTEYHRDEDAAHTFDGMDPSCVSAGCHAANTLPEAHAPYMASYPQYEDTCALCHLNDDPNRIDWATASAGCSTCHTVHGDLDALHMAPDSQECVDCHEVADVRVLHAADPADSCGVCHNDTVDTSGATACVNCHDYSPADPLHYDPVAHIASEPSECFLCHYTELKPEHFKDSSGPVSCVECHESAVDDLVLAWDQTCADCHVVKHQDTHAAHTTPNIDCTVSGCHATDITYVHQALPGYGCPSCHDRDSLPISADCADCHTTYHADSEIVHTAVEPASEDCGRCHDADPAPGVNVQPVHVDAAEGECAVCHDNPGRVPDITATTAECVSCHAISGSDYHRDEDAAHTFDGMDPSCVSAGCHAANTLPEAHAPYMASYPQYEDTCALCHLNDDPGRIDWATASADCSTCHDIHGDLDAVHMAPDSQECVDCHETADVRAIHASDPADSCVVCHNSTVTLPATSACVSCHDYSPADPLHYDPVIHAADEVGCDQCHYVEMKPEHFKASSGPVSCVECHQLKVDDLSSWDKTCVACHDVRHEDQDANHVSTTPGCDGSGCHYTQDVSVVHGGSSGGGGAGSSDTLFSDGFEDGFDPWTSNSYWTTSSSYKHSGNYSARMSRSGSTHSIEKRFDADGADSLDIEFWLKGNSNTESADWVRVYVRDASGSWRQVWQKTLQDRNSSWEQISISADASEYGPFDTDSGIRIQAWVSYSNEYQYVDDVVVTGDMPGGAAPPAPEDDTGCEYCHESPDMIPTTTDCSDCHSGEGHELREPIGECASSGCHSVSEIHNQGDHEDEDCGTCHGEDAPGCTDSGCHSQNEIHGEGDHPNDCSYCHTSGIQKPHETIGSPTSDSSWRNACENCHRRTHSSSCGRCHGTGQREDVHDESAHWRNSACNECHSVQPADQSLSCTSCHSNGGSSSDSYSDGDGWGSWGR